MDEILKAVAAAEEAAAKIKSDASAEAAKIAAEAALKAAEIKKSTEESLKGYRETALKEAESRFEVRTQEALKRERETSAAYADEILRGTDKQVGTIVRRICDGDSRHA